MMMVSFAMKGQIRIYPLPEKDGPALMSDHEVSVCPSGSTQWQSVPTLRCDVDLSHRQQASFAEFDMEGTIKVKVKSAKLKVNNDSIFVRPASRGIKPQRIDDETIELTLEKPEYLSIEFNGDRHHNLNIFANPMLDEHHTPDEPQAINWTGENSQDVFVKDASMIYFGPGVHKPKDLPSEEIKIPSNCTVYLAPGAVVKARLIVDRAENVRIIGRGILDHPLRGIEITYSKNVLVDGITVLNPAHYTVYGGQSEDITLRHIKTFSCCSWSDGFDLMCCRRVRIEDCFLRTSDDCIALYNHRWWYWGGTEDVEVTRCTMWPDVAHPVNIGSHGDDRSETGETLQNVRIHDCDIVYSRTDAALKFSCGDKNWVRDVRFTDIRLEGLEETALFGIAVVFGSKYNRAPGNGIDDITFENIRVTNDTTQLRPSFISDYDATHRVGDRISFKNVTVNGETWNPTKEIKRQ